MVLQFYIGKFPVTFTRLYLFGCAKGDQWLKYSSLFVAEGRHQSSSLHRFLGS